MKLAIASKLKALLDGTHRVLRIVDQFENWSEEQQRAFIDEAFFEQVKYCRNYVPYYGELFATHGIHENDFTTISAIHRIPILTKEIVRDNYEKLKSTQLDSMSFISRRSGGTTGEPIKAYISKEAAAYETFSYFKGLRWMGFKPDMKFVKFFGGSMGGDGKKSLRNRVYQWASNSIGFPAYEIDHNTVHTYHKELKDLKSICLIGYASALDNFATQLRTQNLKLDNVDLVLTTSDQLILDWRLNLENVFQCSVRSYYGCGEVASLGYQTAESEPAYKIPRENAYLEANGDLNELLVTQLHNKAQPFIRFKHGDLGELDAKVYPKNITKLIGRVGDSFTRKDGTKISPTFSAHSILKANILVKKYQYVQYSDLKIEFRYEMEEDGKFLSSDEKATINRMISYIMQEPTELIFTQTDQFEVSSSKKHRTSVSVERLFTK